MGRSKKKQLLYDSGVRLNEKKCKTVALEEAEELECRSDEKDTSDSEADFSN